MRRATAAAVLAAAQVVVLGTLAGCGGQESGGRRVGDPLAAPVRERP
ncbi:MAG: hypothetical protein H0V68_04885 [Actinobacteria bacterium]|nr:hypothetical protein [Actinomycetota bacterium]